MAGGQISEQNINLGKSHWLKEQEIELELRVGRKLIHNF